MTCPYLFDDGAYVLGALSSAERVAFERHLSACRPCHKSVAALAVLPGLLGRLDAATAAPAGLTAPPTLLPRILAAAAAERRQERRRRRRQAVAAGIAAACLAAGVGTAVHVVDSAGPGVAMTAMQPVEELPVTAELGLQEVAGGTKVYMVCRYEEGYDRTWTVRLVVYPVSGTGVSTGEQIATWTAASGQEVSVNALTHLPPDEIGRVELQRADHTALLTWTQT